MKISMVLPNPGAANLAQAWLAVIQADSGNDNLPGGVGNDIANGNQGDDHIFGGDGQDVLWGGTSHEHLWGGHGNDYLDVKSRLLQDNFPTDPPEWFTYGGAENYDDMDILYGGWDQDALQANLGGPAPQPGDRLLDWVGAYNVYYTCPAAYGKGVITRAHSPDIIQFLQLLAEADGALDTLINGTSGFREPAIVFPKQARDNSHPPHPDHPGHFTCN